MWEWLLLQIAPRDPAFQGVALHGTAPRAVSELIVPGVVTLAALGGCFLAWWWLRREKDEPLVTSTDLLSEFRKMREEGTITQAEFDRVRAKLGNQIRQEQGQPTVPIQELPPLPREEGDFEWNEIDLHQLDPQRPGSSPPPPPANPSQ
jgi:hypothetical protein